MGGSAAEGILTMVELTGDDIARLISLLVASVVWGYYSITTRWHRDLMLGGLWGFMFGLWLIILGATLNGLDIIPWYPVAVWSGIAALFGWFGVMYAAGRARANRAALARATTPRRGSLLE